MNTVMATVGDRIREAYVLLKERGVNCILEWNEGNHFRDADLRTAKAFAWVLNNKTAEDLYGEIKGPETDGLQIIHAMKKHKDRITELSKRSTVTGLIDRTRFSHCRQQQLGALLYASISNATSDVT